MAFSRSENKGVTSVDAANHVLDASAFMWRSLLCGVQPNPLGNHAYWHGWTPHNFPRLQRSEDLHRPLIIAPGRFPLCLILYGWPTLLPYSPGLARERASEWAA